MAPHGNVGMLAAIHCACLQQGQPCSDGQGQHSSRSIKAATLDLNMPVSHAPCNACRINKGVKQVT